jgi:hypothetical protein
MFGFDSGLPIAPTGEFPGFVNPMEPVTAKTDLVIPDMGDEPPADELAPRRGRRPQPQ